MPEYTTVKVLRTDKEELEKMLKSLFPVKRPSWCEMFHVMVMNRELTMRFFSELFQTGKSREKAYTQTGDKESTTPLKDQINTLSARVRELERHAEVLSVNIKELRDALLKAILAILRSFYMSHNAEIRRLAKSILKYLMTSDNALLHEIVKSLRHEIT